MKDNKGLVETLSNSNVFKDYQRAFTETTGLPVALRAVESWQLPLHGRRGENPFCAMIAERSRSCASCLEQQQNLADFAREQPYEHKCQLGLCDIAIPIRMGNDLIGFLMTGQILQRAPTEAQFDRVYSLIETWGVEFDKTLLREAWFNSRVMSAKQREAVVKLLHIFANHLSFLSNQITVQRRNAEPPIISRARQFIHEHLTEDLTLGQVARAVNASSFYFCKIFKKHAGLNFTEYVSRTRIENARNLLLNPNLRISEIAFEVGFQSLTHFNRVFKKIVGQSPSEYRRKLPTV